MKNYEHIGQNFFYVSDKEAAKLARASKHGRLPRHGYEIEVTLPKGQRAWLQRTQARYSAGSPKRGWVWAVYSNLDIRQRDPRRDVVPSPRRQRGVEKDMLLGILEAIWLDSYMSWAEENGLSYTSGHIPQHVRSLKDIPQAVPVSAKKLARKYASILVKVNRATLTQIYDRAVRAEGREVGAVKLGFDLAMQGRGHGVSWTDDHAKFSVLIPRGEWYAYGKKGSVKIEGYVGGGATRLS